MTDFRKLSEEQLRELNKKVRSHNPYLDDDDDDDEEESEDNQ